MSALLWFLFGLGIMVLELVQPGFIVIFFGIGAWITALVVWLGGVESLNVQLLVFQLHRVPPGPSQMAAEHVAGARLGKRAFQVQAGRFPGTQSQGGDGHFFGYFRWPCRVSGHRVGRDRQAKINRAEGDKQEAIARSEGEMQKRINEAEGEAQEILRVANATAEGIRQVAKATQEPGGIDAVSLRIAQRYLEEFGRLAQTNNTMIIPTNLSDVAGLVGSLGKVFDSLKADGPSASVPPQR